ncbi:ATP-dependent zinc metalloprotease FtsH [bacterium]|nr:ATP-dependent zinc metalloprotease FtsH [bacterium]
MNNLAKNFILVVLMFLVISAIFSLFSSSLEEKERISISQLVDDINQEKVEKITVSGNQLLVLYKDGKRAFSTKEFEVSLSQCLINYGIEIEKLREVNVEQKEVSSQNWILIGTFISSLLPLLLFVAFFWFLFKQAKTGTMQTFDFTRAKPRLSGPGMMKERVTFEDVGGLKEAKEELKEVVDFLKNPKKYLKMGARIPRGVLLIGAPGTGKTLLARAVASQGNVPFFSISGSEFIELFVGVGASRIRSLFDQARRAKNAIIFIDEIDSIGKIRGVGITGGHEEREQTLNQLLAEMDGIGREEGIIVMAATNKPEQLDPALLRPGRFDRRIILDLPDINEREEILKIHCREKPLALNVNLREIAERTPGFSGADLANVVNEAAILAAKRGKNQIFQEEFLESIEKVLLGPERKSHILSKKEKEIAAFHEAGHALVSSSLPGTEPVRKISIIARGLVAGYTLKVPTEEKRIKTKSEFLAEMATLLGGYCAEKIKFGEITTGAANDLEKASELARKLVKEYGMSSLGPISFGEREKLLFLGRESEIRNYSEEIAAQIDKEVAKFVKKAEKMAREILVKKRKLLEKIAKRLIEKETIEKEEFEQLIGKGKKLKKKISEKKASSIRVKVKRL